MIKSFNHITQALIAGDVQSAMNCLIELSALCLKNSTHRAMERDLFRTAYEMFEDTAERPPATGPEDVKTAASIKQERDVGGVKNLHWVSKDGGDLYFDADCDGAFG